MSRLALSNKRWYKNVRKEESVLFHTRYDWECYYGSQDHANRLSCLKGWEDCWWRTCTWGRISICISMSSDNFSRSRCGAHQWSSASVSQYCYRGEWNTVYGDARSSAGMQSIQRLCQGKAFKISQGCMFSHVSSPVKSSEEKVAMVEVAPLQSSLQWRSFMDSTLKIPRRVFWVATRGYNMYSTSGSEQSIYISWERASFDSRSNKWRNCKYE